MARKIPPRAVPRDRHRAVVSSSGTTGGRSVPGAHTHLEAHITDLDKFSQAAADARFAAISHTHTESEITDLDKYSVAAADAAFAALVHTHVEANITDLDKYSVAAADAAFAPISHTHLEADITDLQAYLVSPLTTNGDVLYYNAGHQRLAKGSDTQVLTLAAGVPTWATPASPGVTDHGALTGLTDDDHSQYHTDARGDARYSVLAHTHLEADITDLGSYSVVGHTHLEADITDLGNYSVVGHTHVEADITDLDKYSVAAADAAFAALVHTHSQYLTSNASDSMLGSSTYTVGGTAESLIPNWYYTVGSGLVGGWARGWTYRDAVNATIGGLGALGTGQTFTHMYMGYGATPHASANALIVASGTLKFEDTNVSLEGHTHVEADITDLGSYSVTGHTHLEADITDLQNYSLVGHTHGYLPLSGGTLTGSLLMDAGIYLRGGHLLRIQDSTNSDYGTFDHNGTDFRLVLTGSRHFAVSGATGQFQFGGAGGMRLDNNAPYRATNIAGTGSIELMQLNGSDEGVFMSGGEAATFNGALDVVGALTENSTQVSLAGHTHVEADITDLGSYSVTGHTHLVADVTDFDPTDYLPLTSGTLSSSLTIDSVNPQLNFRESDQAVDEKRWDFRSQSGILSMRAVNDAYTLAGYVWQATRTGYTVDTFNVLATQLLHNSVAVSLAGHTHTQSEITDFGGPYLPLTGGTLSDTLTISSGHLYLPTDTAEIRVGADGDGRFYHNGANTYLYNKAGNLRIYVNAAGGGIQFYTSDTLRATIQQGGETNWTGTFTSTGNIRTTNGTGFSVGTSYEMRMYSNTASYLYTTLPVMYLFNSNANGSVQIYTNSIQRWTVNNLMMRQNSGCVDVTDGTLATGGYRINNKAILNTETAYTSLYDPTGVTKLIQGNLSTWYAQGDTVYFRASAGGHRWQMDGTFFGPEGTTAGLDLGRVGTPFVDGFFSGTLEAGTLTEGGTGVSLQGHTHLEADITDLQSYALASHDHIDSDHIDRDSTRDAVTDLDSLAGGSETSHAWGNGAPNQPASYGSLLHLRNSDVNTQFAMSHAEDAYWRGAAGSSLVGIAWKTLLDSSNYGGYSTFTGDVQLSQGFAVQVGGTDRFLGNASYTQIHSPDGNVKTYISNSDYYTLGDVHYFRESDNTNIMVLNNVRLAPYAGVTLNLGDATDEWNDLFLASGGSIKFSNTKVIDWVSTYTTIYDSAGNTTLSLGGTTDLRNYYTNDAHRFRSKALANLMQFDTNTLNIYLNSNMNKLANAETSLIIGEPTTIRGGNQRGALYIYGENTGVAMGGIKINATGSNAQFTSVGTAGHNIQFIPDALCEVLSGLQLGLRDSTNVDYARWSHDGTDFNLAFGGTTDYNITGLAASGSINLASYGQRFAVGGVSRLSGDATYTYIYDGAGATKLWVATTGIYYNADNHYFRSGGSNHQLTMTSTKFGPYDENNVYDLGSTGLAFKDQWMAGNINLLDGGSVIQTPNAAGGSIWTPGGANLYSSATGQTGAIKITLPVDAPADMMSFQVTVFDYSTNQSFTLNVGGYCYNVGIANPWINEFAYITQSPSSTKNHTVRFGHDGANACIYIGELADVWAYPQIQVFNFISGYTTTIADYDDGWDVTFEASAFENLDHTHTDITIGVGAFVDPMTTHGDIIWYNGGAARLARGNDNDVLTMNGTSLNWEAPTGGYTDPLTTDGDVLIRDTTTKRLPKGANGEVLTLTAGLPAWEAASGGISVTVSTSAASGGGSDGDLWCRI